MSKKDIGAKYRAERMQRLFLELATIDVTSEVSLVNEQGEKKEFQTVACWIDTLSLARDQGWIPNGGPSDYARQGRFIPAQEAGLIAEALGKVILDFENDNMDLRGLIDFLGKGGFRIDVEQKGGSH